MAVALRVPNGAHTSVQFATRVLNTLRCNDLRALHKVDCERPQNCMDEFALLPAIPHFHRKTQLSRTLRISSAMMLLASSAGAQVIVTPSNPQGWGLDPVRAPLNGGVQAITSEKPRSGAGSLSMSITNDGNSRTGFALFASGGGNFGALSQMNRLGFDWLTATTLQSPTLRLYLNIDNPAGGSPLLAQYAWYADNAINGSVPLNSWTTTNLVDGDNQNNFFLRLFGPSGQVGTDCAASSRFSDFNDHMQSTSAWQSACNGGAGKLDFSTAKVIGIGVDYGSFPGDGLTNYKAFADNVTIGFGDAPATTYNFEPNTTVPEPASFALMGAGLVGVFGFARRRRNSKLA